MSDLHMELWDNSRYVKANEFEVMGDVLVLAGASILRPIPRRITSVLS